MNKFGSILISVIILLTFSFCCATKSNMKDVTKDKHPFKVINATYNTWVGGQPGVKGIRIAISIDNPEIKLDTVFFRNMKTKLKREINSSPTIFVGVFTFPNTEHDYILHQDPVKEYGNTPPKTSLNIPFELDKKEAVISYLFEGTLRYYKIKEVIETKSDTKY